MDAHPMNRPPVMRRLLAVVAILACAACGSLRLPVSQVAAADPLASPVDRVVRVVDGDTIVTADHPESVRLLLADAPETRSNRHGRASCWGQPAKARLAQLLTVPADGTRSGLSGATVTLVPDRDLRDRYGRMLAYVLAVGPDGELQDVGLRLVAEGLAYVLVVPPNGSREAAYRAALASAKTDGLGIWSQAALAGGCP